MPRTKRTSNNKKQKVQSLSNEEKLTRNKEIDAYIKDFDLNCKRQLEFEDSLLDNALQELKLIRNQCRALVSRRIGNTTLEDLEKTPNSTYFTTATDSTSYTSNFLEITNAVKSVKVRKNRRSVSLVDDEAENPRGTRRSRSKNNYTKVVRQSRSLSRSKAQQTRSVLNNLKTPLNQAPKNDFGFITPKIKPNTPQVILRRPIEGEMALSMQGSPLLVNTVISRDANVNIPLGDGRTISIQPQHGLRMSQLPVMDATIRQQIEVLRDNLIKVCNLTNKKKPKS